MDRAREQFEAAGARLFFIGQATPPQAAHFRRRQGLHVPMLADQGRESYRAVGARKANVAGLVAPSLIAKGAVATARTRQLQTRPIGDAAQLGGALLIRPDGSIAWSHISQDPSDNAHPREMLAALQSDS